MDNPAGKRAAEVSSGAMRILHVDSGHHWRGGQAQVLLLVSGLRERGHDQLLAAPEGSPLLQRVQKAGIAIHPLKIRGDLDAAAWLQLTAVARRFRPTLIHAHSAHAQTAAVAAARLAGIPGRVVTRRSGLARATPFSRAKYRSGVSRYIAISRHVADTLIAGGVDPDRISVVYSGVPISRDQPAFSDATRREARARLEVTGEGPVLAVVGALTREKGHDLALAALSRMEVPARLVLVGEGPLRAHLESRAARLGLKDRALLAGFRPDLGSLWPAFDLVLAPSRHEGLGTSVLEALGHGIPAVVSSAGGLREIVEGDEGGVVLASDDAEAWARKVDWLLRNEDARNGLSARGRERARQFTPERMISGTEEVYVNLFPGRAVSAGGRGSAEVGS